MEKLAVEGKDHLLHHLNLNEVLEIKKNPKLLLPRIGYSVLVQCRTLSGTILKRERGIC